MNYLSESEVDVIMEYTGMEEVVHMEMFHTPVVFFSRTGGMINFVTVMSDFLKGNKSAL